MRKLLNTLYVTSENSYLALDGENIVILEDSTEIGRLPLHNLEGIVSFGYKGIKSCTYGSMCGSEYFFVLYDTSGEIFGQSNGKGKRKCYIERTAVCQYKK